MGLAKAPCDDQLQPQRLQRKKALLDHCSLLDAGYAMAMS